MRSLLVSGARSYYSDVLVFLKRRAASAALTATGRNSQFRGPF